MAIDWVDRPLLVWGTIRAAVVSRVIGYFMPVLSLIILLG